MRIKWKTRADDLYFRLQATGKKSDGGGCSGGSCAMGGGKTPEQAKLSGAPPVQSMQGVPVGVPIQPGRY